MFFFGYNPVTDYLDTLVPTVEGLGSCHLGGRHTWESDLFGFGNLRLDTLIGPPDVGRFGTPTLTGSGTPLVENVVPRVLCHVPGFIIKPRISKLRKRLSKVRTYRLKSERYWERKPVKE